MMARKLKKEVVEWIVIILIAGIVYLGGWHTAIIGRLQQLVLSTGMITPTLVEEDKKVSYNFQVENLNGETIPFSSFREQVVFLNFWATWCPPCIAEMPDIQNLYDLQKEKVTFVMISLDKDEQKARDFIMQKGFDFPVYFLRSALPNTYQTHSIPTTYLIDKSGFVKVQNHGMAKYNTKAFNSMLDKLGQNQEYQ